MRSRLAISTLLDELLIICFCNSDLSGTWEALEKAGGRGLTVLYWNKDNNPWLLGPRLANDLVQPMVVAFFGNTNEKIINRYSFTLPSLPLQTDFLSFSLPS